MKVEDFIQGFMDFTDGEIENSNINRRKKAIWCALVSVNHTIDILNEVIDEGGEDVYRLVDSKLIQIQQLKTKLKQS